MADRHTALLMAFLILTVGNRTEYWLHLARSGQATRGREDVDS